jgi:hypothetical protein
MTFAKRNKNSIGGGHKSPEKEHNGKGVQRCLLFRTAHMHSLIGVNNIKPF